MPRAWKTIPDDCVRLVWAHPQSSARGDCTLGDHFSPGWFDGNGTPSCDCGEDLVYTRTEVDLSCLTVNVKRRSTNRKKEKHVLS